ncbi:MAG TPA: universal stress protein [Smithellaceae bacterium]|jgi:nucleotide-binding universal stress UspA family protein|nr:universal stress protein [Smithellaceae bacterium]HPL67880.1 universal stress protein [Smithellaceae bacterium]HQG66706.1 universal stress protein [Smithella sp.]
MIKRIIVPLDESKYSENAVKTACQIAKIHDSEVTGLVVIDTIGISKSVGPIPLGGAYYGKKLEESKTEKEKEKIDQLLKCFKSICSQEGVRHREHKRQGLPSEKILEQSLFHDLIVIGMKTYYKYNIEGKPGNSFIEIMDHSITPILVVPKNYTLPEISKTKSINVLIAFDGSLPSCRAIQRFAQLPVSEFADIQILMSHSHEKYAEHYLSDAKEFLICHGFSRVRTCYTRNEIIKDLEDNYMEWTDLFVLGMHSRRVLLDFFVGSLASYLIMQDKKYIFFGQ